MKKLFLLSLLSGIFVSDAMESQQKKSKRPRSNLPLPQRAASPIDEILLKNQNMQFNEWTEREKEFSQSLLHYLDVANALKAVFKMGDKIEENFLMIPAEQRELCMEILSTHMRNIVMRNERLPKAFSQDFIEALQKQSKEKEEKKVSDQFSSVPQANVISHYDETMDQ